jgi:predicted ester cyclase
MYKGFPDFHVTIEDVIAEGDKVCVRVKYVGTNTGEYRGLAPTGKKIAFTSVQIYRVVDRKIVEREAVFDMLDFLEQLGSIEYTEKAKKLTP